MPCSSRLLVYIVTGHGPKAAGYWDPGAVGTHTEEAMSVRDIAGPLSEALKAEGVIVVIDNEDHYFQRHARLALIEDDFDVVAVIHLHHNSVASSRPRYAATMHDSRSKQGEALSRLVAAELASIPGAPWGNDARVIKTYDDRGKVERPWLFRAFGCIDEVFGHPAHVSATLIELGFVSHPETDRWYSTGARPGVAASARATAAGVIAWLRQRAIQLGK